MRVPMIFAALLAGVTLSANGVPDPQRLERARETYEALQRGDLHRDRMTAQELREIAWFLRTWRNGDRRSEAERCLDRETARVGGSPSELERNVIDMKCRVPGTPLP